MEKPILQLHLAVYRRLKKNAYCIRHAYVCQKILRKMIVKAYICNSQVYIAATHDAADNH